jgi:hypothetical protein
VDSGELIEGQHSKALVGDDGLDWVKLDATRPIECAGREVQERATIGRSARGSLSSYGVA